ncbi:hypothetical protein D3C71_1886020 [compost metagenome]
MATDGRTSGRAICQKIRAWLAPSILPDSMYSVLRLMKNWRSMKVPNTLKQLMIIRPSRLSNRPMLRYRINCGTRIACPGTM